MESRKEERLSKDTCQYNIKTKEILALEVTDEKVHDSKVMKNLVDGVLNNNHNINIKSFIGDAGAYDNMRISNT